MELPVDSLIAALIIACAYLTGGRVDSSEAVGRFWSHRRSISAAAGVSVAYVFVDVLPELELQRKVLVNAASGAQMLFAEQRIYLLALWSFVVFYGLQHMVLLTRDRRRNAKGAGHVDGVYRLQLTSYAAYSALIGYLLLERSAGGVTALAAFAFAMALHFLIVDHALSEEHGDTYRRSARWLLAVSVLAGWLIGVLLPVSEVVIARLFAILAGGVVITSLGSELPNVRSGSFWPFCLGAMLYAGVLLFA